MDSAESRLPYEELDPCCQKEIDDNRKNAEITSILREKDRTYKRLDERSQAITRVSRSITCECCKEQKDYPILRQLRALAKQSEAAVAIDVHSESEDDDSLDLDMDFLTPFEQERLNEMKLHAQAVEQAKSIGFTTHVEDSVEHVSRDIQSGFSIVLHLYDPDSQLCGELDLVLESLALKYIGTKFRRIQFNQDVITSSLLANFSRELNSIHIANSHSAVLCFVDKHIIAHTYTFNEFSGGDSIHTADLVKYLDHTHVLSTALSYHDMKFFLQSSTEEEEEEGREKNTYCDDPDCIRRFPHEHIGRSGDSSGGGEGTGYRTAAFMKSSNVGEDALAKNVFLQTDTAAESSKEVQSQSGVDRINATIPDIKRHHIDQTPPDTSL